MTTVVKMSRIENVTLNTNSKRSTDPYSDRSVETFNFKCFRWKNLTNTRKYQKAIRN